MPERGATQPRPRPCGTRRRVVRPVRAKVRRIDLESWPFQPSVAAREGDEVGRHPSPRGLEAHVHAIHVLKGEKGCFDVVLGR
eukprot:scaffold1102_cov256-Pinguiococcus_pyrenoidosus.AAC.16